MLARNKAGGMDALLKAAELDVPKALVHGEVERMIEAARADMKKRGMKDADKAPMPAESSSRKPNAACASAWWWPNWCAPTTCKPSPSSCKQHIDEMAHSYEKPAEVVRWYLGDRQRMAEVEAS